MIEFRIHKQSTRSRARLGSLTTPHGTFETPAFVPVATQATVKTLTSEQALAAGSQLLIANTFHLHLKPSEDIVAGGGGLHQFMQWPRPLMTDSGGFQVFSLGFGRDHGVGKMLSEKRDEVIALGQQPSRINITERGVMFTSPVDGAKIYLDPKKSIDIQQKLGADIMFAFDEATSPVADKSYTRESLARTHRWAQESLAAKTSDQALFGIVQGGKFKELRLASARTIGGIPFDGFGIGGEYGNDKKTMLAIIKIVIDELPSAKPRHLLGIGHLEDIPQIIKAGVDTFDCIVPTHYARHGTAFANLGGRAALALRNFSGAKFGKVSHHRLDLTKRQFLTDQSPLDAACSCAVCKTYTRAYISHLVRAKEVTGLQLLTFHNLYFFNAYVTRLREQIRHEKI
ncbi:MAG: tRNA guanosine(34) transglycosylase Tgt [Candidatus Andersenbacteria bacterium CG10_big_fil_rev_8_21_14_0_10_54_11]|uniref:Queuine tRNA-ribosyltransferase n=1 Tax=Candidatus Andersenbacteria bacterium CG10_big_fil_rev_8_21_14_0_10_54_11 TaxID=1974485 RepID=A0A2M6WYR4_9BACT|nr:MAG: tRNA guanosine(34) transglycosylase Tgt [Candidatus Andersenbacteria bacterium CG10_big_fil_rev_8_21_14_0_10_54_11]